MLLTPEEVKHIAKLAHLELSEAQIARYCEQLSDILAHIAKLNRLDTTEISPTANAVQADSSLRADQVRPPLTNEKLLQNAPAAQDGQFKVPAVLNGKK